jgi:hypothetical protein
MPKREELSQILSGRTQNYSLLIEGLPAIHRSDIVTDDKLISGDKVGLFALPGGKTFISKVDPNSEDVYTIGRITPAHIYFDDDISVQEL